MLGVFEFAPKVVDLPVEFTIGERFAMFDDFSQFVDLLSLINSEL